MAILDLYGDIGGRVRYRLYVLPDLERGGVSAWLERCIFVTDINFCVPQRFILPKSLVIKDRDVELGG
jgi:hypothetical protein